MQMLKTPKVRRILTPALLAASLTTASLATAPSAGASAPSARSATSKAEQGTPVPEVFTPEEISPAPEARPETPEPKADTGQKPAPAAPAKQVKQVKQVKKKRWMLPVRDYVLTGRFGGTGARWASSHTGLDFAAPKGTRIRSVGSGKVISTSYHSAYGNMTVVRHKTGTVFWYCHQNRTVAKPGEHVKAGETIGRVGSTGNSTGPHLHLEVHQPRQGAVNPERWLKARGLGA